MVSLMLTLGLPSHSTQSRGLEAIIPETLLENVQAYYCKTHTICEKVFSFKKAWQYIWWQACKGVCVWDIVCAEMLTLWTLFAIDSICRGAGSALCLCVLKKFVEITGKENDSCLRDPVWESENTAKQNLCTLGENKIMYLATDNMRLLWA